jgi:serine/threonine protein kinase
LRRSPDLIDHLRHPKRLIRRSRPNPLSIYFVNAKNTIQFWVLLNNSLPHICLVTDVMGGDVRSLLRDILAKHKAMPFPLAKRILWHTLRGIAYMHRCGVIHTDLRSDNIVFDASTTTDDFASLAAADPPQLNPPEYSWECTVQTAVSQPLSLPSISEAITRTFLVADFGSGV